MTYYIFFVKIEIKPLTTADQINKDVSEATKGLIKEIVKPEMIKENPPLVLTNAIYFKGDWQKQFDKSETKPMKFKVSSNKIIDYPEGMNLRANLNYAKIKGKV